MNPSMKITSSACFIIPFAFAVLCRPLPPVALDTRNFEVVVNEATCRFKYFVTFLPFRDSVSMESRPTTFHELHSRYADDVYRFAYWLTGNPHVAQDITSETFVRAWTAPEEPRMASVKAYLFTIARNLHRKQWRRQSRLEVLDETMPDHAVQPDQAAVNHDEFRQTLAAVHALPETERMLLLLRAEQELSYQDISTATGLSIAAVKVRVFRARVKLTALLHPNSGEKL